MFLRTLSRCNSQRLTATSLTWRISGSTIVGGGRFQSTVVDTAPNGAPVTDTNRAEATQKRFWKTVGIEPRDSLLTVTLDGRSLKTPSGHKLLLPKDKNLAATLIAAEWDHQEILLKPHALPMTSIVSRALDAMQDPATREEVHEQLLRYLDTDTVCFFHNEPEPLERLQSEHWTPLLDWARKAFDIKINVSNSVLAVKQPAETRDKLKQVLESLDHWELAAVERATYASKSIIIAIAIVKKHLTVEQAALAASVEVDSQIQRWGEVEDTHDVDYQDVRRQLGSAVCILSTL